MNAIVEGDYLSVKGLLAADPNLVTGVIGQPRLYEDKIFHWIYVNDTALHLAAAGHRVEIVRLLLSAGADPNATGNRRRSGPLHYAADGLVNAPAWDPEQQVETIQILVRSGADLNSQDRNGATPLHRAVRTRCASAVDCLLNAGADLALRNLSGSTPLHLAVQQTGRGGSGAEVARIGQRAIIESLLSNGADPKAMDDSGKTALDCAKSDWVRELLIRTAG